MLKYLQRVPSLLATVFLNATFSVALLFVSPLITEIGNKISYLISRFCKCQHGQCWALQYIRSITDCNGLRICEMLLIDCIASGFVLELCCHLFLQTRHLFLSHAIKTQQNCQLCRLVEWRQHKYIQQGIQRKTFIFFLENLQSCFSSLTYQNN